MLKTVKNGCGIRVDPPPPCFFKIPTFSRFFCRRPLLTDITRFCCNTVTICVFALVLLFCQTDLICIFKFSHLCCHKMHSTFEPTKLNGVVNVYAIVNIYAAVECLSLIVRIRPLGCQFPAMWFRLQRKTAKTRYVRTIQVLFFKKLYFIAGKIIV